MVGDQKPGSWIRIANLLLLVVASSGVVPAIHGQRHSNNVTLGASFVQQSSATPQANEQSVTVTYGGAQTAGDTNIVAIGWNSSTSSVSSVTDSEGNSYLVAVPIATGNALSQTIYYAPNIKGAAARSNVVTVNFSSSVPAADIRVLEYSGLASSGPFDAGASASGSGSTASSGSARTTNSSDIIFGAGMTVTTFSSAGSGFTRRVITSPDGDIAEDEVVSTTGSYAATGSLSSGPWLMQVAAFRAAGGGSSTTIPPTISSFSASPSQIAAGSSTVLSWNASNASSIAITPGTDSSTSLSGSTTMSPTSTTTYTLTATNAGGSVIATVTVNVDSTPPTVPSGLAASATGASSISLSWSPSSDSGGPGVAGYDIYRCTGTSCSPSTLIGTSPSPSYGDTGLSASTSYNYSVAAYDTLGLTSAKSFRASARTQSASLPTISSFVANPTSIFSGQSSTLSWNVGNATSLSVNNGVGSVTGATSVSVSPTVTTTYTLTATNSSGTTTARATVTVSTDSTPPSTPTGLKATALSSSAISLAWSASTDTGGPGLAGYDVYRCTGASCTPSTVIGTSTTTSFNDTGLTASITYTYAVAAYDTQGLASSKSSPASATSQSTSSPTINSFAADPASIFSGQSSTLSWSATNATSLSISGVGAVTNSTSTSVRPSASTTYTLTATNSNGSTTAQVTVTVSPDSTPPSTPSGLTASASSASSISLSWPASTDSGGPGLSGYNIYRCTGASCTPSTQVGTSSATSYTDSGLTASTPYTYAVAAYDTLGLASPMSSTASATTNVANLSPVPFAAYSSGTDNAYYQNPIAALASPTLIMYPKTPGGGFVGGSNNCAVTGIYSAPGLTQTPPTDSASETWTEAASKTAASAGLEESIYYVLGNAAGATRITEALGGSSRENSPPMTSMGGWLVELANCDSSAIGGTGTLDATANGSNLTLTLSSAPSLGDTVILFAIDATAAVDSSSASPTTFENITPGSGYTARILSKTFGKFIEYSSTTTSQSVQFNPGGSDEWLAVALVIKQSGAAGNIPSGKFIDTWQEEQFPSAVTDTLAFPFMGNTIVGLMSTGTQFISSITGSTCKWSTGAKETADGTSAQIVYGTGCAPSPTATVTPTFNTGVDNPGTTISLVSMSNMVSALDTGATTSLSGCSASSGLVTCGGDSDLETDLNMVGITPSAENEISIVAGSISQHTAQGVVQDANNHTPVLGFAEDTKADDAYDGCGGSSPPSTLTEDNPFAFYQNLSDTLPQTFIFTGTWMTSGGLGACLSQPTGTSTWDAVGAAFN